MTPGRRTLRYNDLDEVMPDVERLLQGHKIVGRWSLGQICRHLATVMRMTTDLPASTPVDLSLRLDADRKAEIFESSRLPEGLPMPATLTEPIAVGDRVEADGLRKVIAHYQASPGPAAPHRLFGPLTKDEWDRLQCIHFAHHLSFAIPEAGGMGSANAS